MSDVAVFWETGILWSYFFYFEAMYVCFPFVLARFDRQTSRLGYEKPREKETSPPPTTTTSILYSHPQFPSLSPTPWDLHRGLYFNFRGIVKIEFTPLPRRHSIISLTLLFLFLTSRSIANLSCAFDNVRLDAREKIWE